MVTWDELDARERLYVVKAITARHHNTEPIQLAAAGDLDIALTVNGRDVDFFQFSRRMIDAVNADLDERARELVRNRLDKLDAIIHELSAGL